MKKTPQFQDYANDASPKLTQQFVYRGKTFALPFAFNNMMVWQHTGLLKEQGLDVASGTWSFNDFRAYAQKLTKRQGDQTTQWGAVMLVMPPTSPFHLCPWVFNNGVDGILGGPAQDKPLVTEAGFIDAVKLVHDLVFKDRTMAGPDWKYEGGGIKAMTNGVTAMMLAGRWPMSTMLQAKFTDFEVQLWPKGTRQVTEVGCNLYPLLKAAKNPDAAWAFETLLLSKESIQHLTITKGIGIPARRSIAQVAEFANLPPKGGKLWYESIDRPDIPVMSVTAPPDYTKMESIMREHITRIFANQVTVEEGLRTLQKALEQMVAERPKAWAERF